MQPLAGSFPIVIDQVGAAADLLEQFVRSGLASRNERKEGDQEILAVGFGRHLQRGGQHRAEICPKQGFALRLPEQFAGAHLLQSGIEGRRRLGRDAVEGVGRVRHRPGAVV